MLKIKLTTLLGWSVEKSGNTFQGLESKRRAPWASSWAVSWSKSTWSLLVSVGYGRLAMVIGCGIMVFLSHDYGAWLWLVMIGLLVPVGICWLWWVSFGGWWWLVVVGGGTHSWDWHFSWTWLNQLQLLHGSCRENRIIVKRTNPLQLIPGWSIKHGGVAMKQHGDR